ncbi:MAG: hypothetical protein DCC49_06040 [Acidobacteria bacterium]|nr:MAG: hypothetical protein DCC49_06040 [Acidobacteriota bacterium]
MDTEGRRLRLAAIFLGFLFIAVALGSGSIASAHQGGKAIPKVNISVAPHAAGPLTLAISARITDADSGTPVEGASVNFEAMMTDPHEMWTLPTPMTETAEPGVYSAIIKFSMAAEWKFIVRVDGANVQPATAEYKYRITFQGAEADPLAQGVTSTAGVQTPTRAQVKVAGSLGSGDVFPIASLAIHSLSAIVWVGLTVLLVFAASDDKSRRIGEDFREELLEKGSRWRGVAVAAGVVLVLTGIYNTIVIAPFKIAPTPDAMSNAMKVPFGGTYLAILGSKIVLMALLVVINRIPAKDPVHSARFALKADAVLLPLLLVAVVALRYVHVLSHVAQSVA